MARELEDILFFGEETNICPKSQNVSYGQSNVKDALDDHETRINTLEDWGETNITIGAGRNLYNKDSASQNIANANLTANGIVALSGDFRVAKVPVEESTEYIIYNADGMWGGRRTYAYLDSNGAVIGGEIYLWSVVNENNPVNTGPDKTIDECHRRITTPSGCKFLAIQTQSISNSDWAAFNISDTLMVERGNWPSGYEVGGGEYITEINGKPIRANDNFRKQEFDIPLNTYIMGDSIATCVEGRWADMITKKFSFKYFRVVALGGATWGIRKDAVTSTIEAGQRGGDNNNMLAQVYFIKSLVDGGAPAPQLIFIHAGTNDVTADFAKDSTAMAGDADAPTIGDADTTFNYSNSDYRDWSEIDPVDATKYRTNTTTGGMRITIEKIRSFWPYCKIVVTTPTQRSTNVSNDFSLNTKFWNAVAQIKKAAMYLSVPVIDLAGESGTTVTNLTTFTADSLHPNYVGGQKLADVIGRKLVVLFGTKNWYL